MKRSSFCGSLLTSFRRCSRSLVLGIGGAGFTAADNLSLFCRRRSSSSPASNARAADNHFIIFGLGNPGSEYTGTRHNIGRDTVEHLSRMWRAPLTEKLPSCTHSAPVTVGPARVTLANPETYMNLSGRAVQALSQRLGVPPERLIVLHDDLDVPFGQLKIRNAGSASGQNGVRDILRALGTSAPFLRVRMGIGRPPSPSADVSTFVLSRFTPQEASRVSVVRNSLPKVLEAHFAAPVGDPSAAVDAARAAMSARSDAAPQGQQQVHNPRKAARIAAARAAAEAKAAAGQGAAEAVARAKAAADAAAAVAEVLGGRGAGVVKADSVGAGLALPVFTGTPSKGN